MQQYIFVALLLYHFHNYKFFSFLRSTCQDEPEIRNFNVVRNELEIIVRTVIKA